MNENLYIAHKNLPHKTLRVHSAMFKSSFEPFMRLDFGATTETTTRLSK